MEPRKCKRPGCIKTVDQAKRSDADFCSPKCGWTFRNKQRMEANKEKRLHSRKLDKNHNIIKDLYSRGKIDVSNEALELLGFDFEYCTGIEQFNQQNGITKFKLFEFIITTDDLRSRILKSEL